MAIPKSRLPRAGESVLNLDFSRGFMWIACLDISAEQPEGKRKKVLWDYAPRDSEFKEPAASVWLTANDDLIFEVVDANGVTHSTKSIPIDKGRNVVIECSLRVKHFAWHVPPNLAVFIDGKQVSNEPLPNGVFSAHEDRDMKTSIGASVDSEHPAAFKLLRLIVFQWNEDIDGIRAAILEDVRRSVQTLE